MSKKRTANSRSNILSGKGNDDNSNHFEKNTESLQNETFVEPNINPNDNTQIHCNSQNLFILSYLPDKYKTHL